MALTEVQRKQIEENRLKALERLRAKQRIDRDSKSVENPSGGHANAKGSHTATPQSPQSRIKIHAQAGRPGGHVTAVSSRKGGVTSGESNVFKRLGDVDDRNGCIGDSTDVENSLCLGRGAHSGCDTRQSCEPNSCSLTSGAKGCEECGRTADDAHIDQELLQGFGVSVCRECKMSRGEYQCISKKEAKDKYLLPEGTIAVLRFIERDNPHHSGWTKMKLFLRREVVEYSYKRWGNKEALEEERARREGLKYDRSLARTKEVFKRAKHGHKDYLHAGGYPEDED